MIELYDLRNKQIDDLCKYVQKKFEASSFGAQPLPNGSYLISVHNLPLPHGWNRDTTIVSFVVPPGYPGASPSCMWVEPGGFRLRDGSTAGNSNDSNNIPGDPIKERSTTWFALRPLAWDPNRDTLVHYFQLVLHRLQKPNWQPYQGSEMLLKTPRGNQNEQYEGRRR